MSRVRDKQGKYVATSDPIADTVARRQVAKEELGYGGFKTIYEYTEEMNYQLEKHGVKKASEKTDDLGFTKDFLKFMGLKGGRSYKWDIRDDGLKNNKVLDMLTLDADQSFYTPFDDFYGIPSGQDLSYDSGRIPVSHLMVLATQRLGCVFRACNGTANDVFKNQFEFVKRSDRDKVVARPEILNWMDKAFFWDKIVEILDFGFRSGLGHLVSHWDTEEGLNYMDQKALKTRPDWFESFSTYHMTPSNLDAVTYLDYNRQKWNFRGGIFSSTEIDSSRVYVMEPFRAEGSLRGWALAELCWVPLMCYLNTSYYILKSLAQLGTMHVGITTDSVYPTPAEVRAYLSFQKDMRANKFWILGRGAKFQVENAAGKIGGGIESYLEFLKEDISSAWIIPKNQLFGRAEGGGLEGAGALVSKEDYLSSNLSTKQLKYTNDIMFILKEVCHFPDLEEITLRWNLDLHKTEQHRLQEQLMREQLAQQEIVTKQTKLGFKLYKQQVKLQIEMNKVQMQMLEENPKEFLEGSDKDEENIQEKEVKRESKDFQDKELLRIKYNKYKEMLDYNIRLLKDLNREYND